MLLLFYKYLRIVRVTYTPKYACIPLKWAARRLFGVYVSILSTLEVPDIWRLLRVLFASWLSVEEGDPVVSVQQ